MTADEWRAVFARLAELVEQANTSREWGDEAQPNGTLIRLLEREGRDGEPPASIKPGKS